MKLLESEVDYVHLRHPGASKDTLQAILEEIDPALRKKITLHDHYELAVRDLAGGIQLNSRNSIKDLQLISHDKDATQTKSACLGRSIRSENGNFSGIRISKSCHSINEIRNAETSGNLEYVTLSPIFDSISKSGYLAAFDINILRGLLHSCQLPVIALGGVTPDKIPLLESLGFRGVAMLGYYSPLFK